MPVTTTASLHRRNSSVLEHEEFCQPQPTIDGTEPAIRTETFLSERMDRMTGLPVGAFTVTRCIECGAQVNTDVIKDAA